VKAIRVQKGKKFVIRVVDAPDGALGGLVVVGEIGGNRAARNGYVVVRQSSRSGAWVIDGSRQDYAAAVRLREDCLRRMDHAPVANPDGSYRYESYRPNSAALVLEVEG
jgi:hypothetical protein